MSGGGRASSVQKRMIIVALWPIQEGSCALCGDPLSPVDAVDRNCPDATTIEHIVGRGAGGSNDILNSALAHMKCNAGRGDGAPPPRLLRMRTRILRHFTREPEALKAFRDEFHRVLRRYMAKAMR